MNYEETIEYIHKTPKFSRILGNTLLSQLLQKLGNPHLGMRYIHIGGTNGKGSSVTMTANALRCAGYSVGVFTSPYLERFNERISVSGVLISDDDLSEIATKVRSCMEENQMFVSEFALDLTIAFLYFKEQKCDFVVLEVGMGGRLDATNVIPKSLVTALTSIGRDHVQYLGDSLTEIAREKCGIIKNGGTVVVAPGQEECVMNEIAKACRGKNAKMIPADLSAADGYKIGIPGGFQKKNAAVAITVLKELKNQGYSISERDIFSGIETAFWAGRFEKINENLILDGAHNVPAAKALAAELSLMNKKIHLVTAMMKDKEAEEVARILAAAADKVTLTEIEMPRCCPADELKKMYERAGCEAEIIVPAAEAVKSACKSETHTVCVCGSLYLVGEIRKQFLRHE